MMKIPSLMTTSPYLTLHRFLGNLSILISPVDTRSAFHQVGSPRRIASASMRRQGFSYFYRILCLSHNPSHTVTRGGILLTSTSQRASVADSSRQWGEGWRPASRYREVSSRAVKGISRCHLRSMVEGSL